MAKPEWGVKRQCLSCAARFYDLNHDPIACPECGATFEVEALARAKRLRPGPRAEPVSKVADIDAEDIEIDEDEDAALVDDEDAEDATLVVDDETDDVAPVAAPTADVDDADDDLGDDDVLLEDDEDAPDADLGDLVEDKGDEDLRT